MVLRKCAVAQCPRVGSLFKVPCDPQRAEKFLRFINKDELCNWTLKKLHNNVGICERHFEERFISRSPRATTLAKTAFPTLHPPTLSSASNVIPSSVESPPVGDQPSTSCSSQGWVYGYPPSQPLYNAGSSCMVDSPSSDCIPLLSDHGMSCSAGIPVSAHQEAEEAVCTPTILACTPTKPVHPSTSKELDNHFCNPTSEVPSTPSAMDDKVSTPVNIPPLPFLQSSTSTPRQHTANTSTSCKARKRLPILSSLGIGRKSLTPRKSTPLYRKLQQSEYSIKKMKRKLSLAAKKIRRLKRDLEKPSTHRLSQTLKLLVEGESRNRRRKLKGRRWTREEKMLAVSLMKRGPKLYRHMSKIMTLPSKKVLNRFLSEIPFSPGMLKPMLAVLAKKAEKMLDSEKLCVVMFDEMAIQEAVTYLPHEDRIAGFEELGTASSKLVANHALVFMVRSLCGKWKLPIAYYFVRDGLTAPTYASLIRSCCIELARVGLVPIATVCDQGSSNVGAVNFLQQSGENPGPHFPFDGRRIYTFYDAPHLLKSTRNMLLLYTLISEQGGEQGAVKWDHITQTYEADLNFLQQLFRITPTHLKPVHKQKMKVKFAAQVFSRSVSICMQYLIACNMIPQEAQPTAQFVGFMDKLFDSFNSGGKIERPDSLRRNLCDSSPHFQFWESAIKQIHSWKFVDSTAKVRPAPPSQKGWLNNIRAARGLWEDVKNVNGLKSLNMRKVNQDPVENLFSLIRQLCGCNPTPTSVQFTSALKTVAINWVTSSTRTPGQPP